VCGEARAARRGVRDVAKGCADIGMVREQGVQHAVAATRDRLGVTRGAGDQDCRCPDDKHRVHGITEGQFSLTIPIMIIQELAQIVDNPCAPFGRTDFDAAVKMLVDVEG